MVINYHIKTVKVCETKGHFRMLDNLFTGYINLYKINYFKYNFYTNQKAYYVRLFCNI